MKSLRVFVCILIATISIFGVFSTPKKAFAQNTTGYNASNFTETIAKDIALSVFQTEIDVINKDVQRAQALTDARSVAEAKVYTTLAPALIAIITASKDTYLSSFDNSLPVAEAQFKALQAAQVKYQSQIPSVTNDIRKISGLLAILNTSAAQLRGAVDMARAIKEGGNTGNLTTDPAAIASAQAKIAEIKENAIKDKCSFGVFKDMNLTACINQGVSWIIKNTFLEIAGFLLWAAANMFNYSVQIGILNFAEWAPVTLYPIWMIIRQIVSLIIVFVGLYLGFLYILGKDPEKFEKYIPWVVMFALFVNFSYPLARTAVDISNIVSLKIYASAVGNNALTASAGSQNTAGALIMNRLGLEGLVSSATESTGKTLSVVKSIDTVPAALMAVAYVLYAAYIFFMVTGLIVIRTASLVFLIIASPLLLVDSVLPILGDKAKEMRKIFFEQLAVGPVFMIMLALTLKFLEVFSGTMDSARNQAMAGNSTIVTFFNILMMLIMLHIMLKVTKSVSGELGKFATEKMGKVGGFGLGVATGGAGLLARGTMGAAASKMRDSSWVKNNQDSFIGRRAYDLTNSVAKSTFDLRNSSVVAGQMNKIGMGMGMGSKLGYDQATEAKRKDTMERGARITTRHERDVYAKDGTLINRKGDIDEAGQAAKNRFIQTSGGTLLGGTRFMTKEEKKTRDALGEKENEEKAKIIADNKSKSSQDVASYKSINEKTIKDNNMSGTPEQVRADFLNNLKKDLEGLKKTDPNLLGSQAQSLTESIKTIEEGLADEKVADFNAINEKTLRKNGNLGTVKDAKADFLNGLEKELEEIKTKDPLLESTRAKSLLEATTKIKDAIEEEEINEKKKVATEKENFEKQVKDAVYKYKAKADNKDGQNKFFSSLSEDVAIALRKQLTAETITGFDTTKVQLGLSRNPEGESSPMVRPTSTEQQSSSLDIDLSTPFNVEEDIQTMTFAQKAAAKRKAKQEEAAAVARQEIASNGTVRVTTPPSSTPERPTPPTAPVGVTQPVPQPPANDPLVAQSA